jgi:hypothetical protein
MVRWIEASAAALLAAGLAASAAHAQTTGAVQTTGPLTTTGAFQKSPHQTTLQKRAKHAPQAPAGRQITVHARPSYLTLGTGANVGEYNGYVVDTFNQPTPIDGTFTGMRGRERLDGNRFDGPGIPLFRF